MDSFCFRVSFFFVLVVCFRLWFPATVSHMMIIGFFLPLSFLRFVFDLTTVLLLWYELFSTNLIKWTFDCEMVLYSASSTMQYFQLCHFAAKDRKFYWRYWYLITPLYFSLWWLAEPNTDNRHQSFHWTPKWVKTLLSLFWLPTGDTTPTLWSSEVQTRKSNCSV